MTLNYSINGVPFSQLGIFVSNSEGIVDMLPLKDPFAVNWPDAHGEVVDLLRPRFEVRPISLDCFLVAPSAESFMVQSNALLTELVRRETQRLMITGATSKPFVFEVYAKAGLKMKKAWRDGAMVGEFTLNLIEPQPAKYVLRAAGNSTVSIQLTAISPVVLYWGDGTKTEVKGTNQTVTHTYGGSASVSYYLIISGELERLTEHQKTNLTVVWDRLY